MREPAPIKPYLLRALYEWCMDEGLTPYLSVAVDQYTRVPAGHVKEGQITLNIVEDAVHNLVMGNQEITFQARFSGKAFPVVIPVAAVTAIFASENGMGMHFEATTAASPELEETHAEKEADTSSSGEKEHVSRQEKKHPASHLHIVK